MLLSLLISSLCILATPSMDLDSWSFSKDGESWESVRVPHSWNAEDGRSPSYYRGKGYYRTTIECQKPQQPHFLLFEGAAQKAVVLVNGDTLATHKGGYTPFWVDVSGVIQKGSNAVEVICDNSVDNELIPVHSDFNKNGGLHYPVSLMVLPEIYLHPSAYGFDRFHLVQSEVSTEVALVELRTRLCNASSRTRKIKVSVDIRSAEGRLVASCKEKVEVAAGQSIAYSAPLTISNPHLWNGLEDPYMYRVIVKAGRDRAEAQTGLRYFSFDRNNGFFLNGKSYPLRGVSMHQDLEGKASALTEDDINADFTFVRELGCNFLRLAHYPHNRRTFALCDRAGIVVQTEIPWVNVCGVKATNDYFRNIHGQMEEMIRSLYNHPSIVFWGMWNELDSWGNKEWFQGQLDTDKVVSETDSLYRYAKSLDPGRFVGLTDDSRFERERYTELTADYYSQNRYYGWYYTYGSFDQATADMIWIRDNMGPANLSEYGAGVNPFCHTWKKEDIRRHKDDSIHPEAYGNRFHESYVQQIAVLPFLGFTSLWVLFDFAVADRCEGDLDSADGTVYTENPDRMYINDKGIVTRDRKIRKDAFYLYKALWNKAVPTVYITQRRLLCRPAGQEFTMTVYSNARSLKLFQDGVEVASKLSSGDVSGVIWKFSVKMGVGESTSFKVVSENGAEDTVVYKTIMM